ncbi:MAG TPA: enoyl-CoA hydratase-related protein, partial [Candidatus Binataceae bacterium]|nr:enoyl-CoA hydratase-related protein [Candidatus Binataceae bacterium]
GGGYELALATEYIMMADDGSTSVSLPELPLLAVLPGTGGLTRLVDKRRVRRDLADVFCTTEEGVRGKRAVDWRLVDEVVARTRLLEVVRRKALQLAAASDRPSGERGIALRRLERTVHDNRIEYQHLTVEIDRVNAAASIMISGPQASAPATAGEIPGLGVEFWPLAFARELEDAILHLRFNEDAVRTWVFRARGDGNRVSEYDGFLADHANDWLVREVILYLKRTLKRLDVSSRSLFTLIEAGSCFCGTLLEVALASDRIYMQSSGATDRETPARIALSAMNFGALPMCNGLSRLSSRFLAQPEQLDGLRSHIGEEVRAAEAERLGLVTAAPDDIDWDDEIRLALESRAAFSSDALTGMEASLRFGGPETIESKIFARLSAWQNWIFQRSNAVGEKGALKLYGSGQRPEFDPRRV